MRMRTAPTSPKLEALRPVPCQLIAGSRSLLDLRRLVCVWQVWGICWVCRRPLRNLLGLPAPLAGGSLLGLPAPYGLVGESAGFAGAPAIFSSRLCF